MVLPSRFISVRAILMVLLKLVRPFQIAQQQVQMSVSIGIAFYPEDGSCQVTLLEAADKAMYKAKKAGANRMYFYDTPNTLDA